MVSILTQIRECITFLTFFEREITKNLKFLQDMVNGTASLSSLFINGVLIMKTTTLTAAAVLVSFAASAMA